MLGPGDNLGRLAKQNGTTVADIAKWNGVRDTRQLGVGVRLIVAKGPFSPCRGRTVNAHSIIFRMLCVFPKYERGDDAAKIK